MQHQNRLYEAGLSASFKGLASHVKKRSRAIASTFRDPDNAGRLIQPREALAIARWETLAGDAVSEAGPGGGDFVSALLGKVSLKGPAINNQGRIFDPANFDNMITRAIDDAELMHATDIDAVVIDMMGASTSQIRAAKARIKQSDPVVPIYIME